MLMDSHGSLAFRTLFRRGQNSRANSVNAAENFPSGGKVCTSFQKFPKFPKSFHQGASYQKMIQVNFKFARSGSRDIFLMRFESCPEKYSPSKTKIKVFLQIRSRWHWLGGWAWFPSSVDATTAISILELVFHGAENF